MAVHAAVFLYFLWRFIRFRYPASLGVALLPVGWIAFALRVETFAREALLWAGAGCGFVLLVLVLRADRGDVRR
jgi:hypothetical protein